MWQILHASFGKFSKLSYREISLNWYIIYEVTTRNTTAYFLAHSVQAKSGQITHVSVSNSIGHVTGNHNAIKDSRTRCSKTRTGARMSEWVNERVECPPVFSTNTVVKID